MEGQARGAFDRGVGELRDLAERIRDALARLARAIATACEEAKAEQARREAERDLWRDELRAEQRRAAEEAR